MFYFKTSEFLLVFRKFKPKHPGYESKHPSNESKHPGFGEIFGNF